MTGHSKRKAESGHAAAQRWHDAADVTAAAQPAAPLDAPTAEGAPTEPPPPPDLPADAVPVVQRFSINGHWQNINGIAIPPPHALPRKSRRWAIRFDDGDTATWTDAQVQRSAARRKALDASVAHSAASATSVRRVRASRVLTALFCSLTRPFTPTTKYETTPLPVLRAKPRLRHRPCLICFACSSVFHNACPPHNAAPVSLRAHTGHVLQDTTVQRAQGGMRALDAAASIAH